MAEQQFQGQNNGLAREVEKMLRIQDATSLAGSMGQLAMGLGVCLGVGFFLAIFLWMIVPTSAMGFKAWFALYILVLVPLLIWYERRTRKDYLSDGVSGIDPNASSMGEHRINQMSAAVGIISSLLVWGPRAIVDGIRGLRGARSAKQDAVFARAALLVADLSKNMGGIAIKRLVRPPEDMETFGRSVDLLDKHGWIGKATDGKSLWLNSTFRQKLRDATGGTAAG